MEQGGGLGFSQISTRWPLDTGPPWGNLMTGVGGWAAAGEMKSCEGRQEEEGRPGRGLCVGGFGKFHISF